MYYSAKNLYNSKVNFGEILKEAVGDRQLIRGIAYVVRATGEETPFFEALHERGLETKVRDMQVFLDGGKKADWDVGIAVDAIRIGEILDVIILVTGDGDFVELVDYLKHHGRQVEAVAFRESSSSKLVEAVDNFTDLSEEKHRFLINYREPRRGRRPAAPKVQDETTGMDPKQRRTIVGDDKPKSAVKQRAKAPAKKPAARRSNAPRKNSRPPRRTKK